MGDAGHVTSESAPRALVSELAEGDWFHSGRDHEGSVYFALDLETAFEEMERKGWQFIPPERSERG